jgi:hypothetical protein
MRVRINQGGAWTAWTEMQFRVNSLPIASTQNAHPTDPLHVITDSASLEWNFSDSDAAFGAVPADTQEGWHVRVWTGANCGTGTLMDDSSLVTWLNTSGGTNTSKNDRRYTYGESNFPNYTLQQGTQYLFCIRLYDGYGWSIWHQLAFIRNGAPGAVQPMAPADGTALSGIVRLEWFPAYDPEGDPVTYTVEWGSGPTTYTNSSIAGTFWDIGPLTAGCNQIFSWHVRATDGYDPGPFGPTWSFRYSGGDATGLEPSAEPGYAGTPAQFVDPDFSTTGKDHVYKVVYRDCTNAAVFQNPSFEGGVANWTFQQGGGATTFTGSVVADTATVGGVNWPTHGSYSYRIRSASGTGAVTSGQWGQVWQSLDLTNVKKLNFDLRLKAGTDGANIETLFQAEVYIDDTTLVYSLAETVNQDGLYTNEQTDAFSFTGTHKISFRLAVVTSNSNARERYMWIDNLRGPPEVKLFTDQDPPSQGWTTLHQDSFATASSTLFSDDFQSYPTSQNVPPPWEISATPQIEEQCGGGQENNNRKLLVGPSTASEWAATPARDLSTPGLQYTLTFRIREEDSGQQVCKGPNSADLKLEYRKSDGSWTSLHTYATDDFNRKQWYSQTFDIDKDAPQALWSGAQFRFRNTETGTTQSGYNWWIDDVVIVRDGFDSAKWDQTSIAGAKVVTSNCNPTQNFPNSVKFGSDQNPSELRSVPLDLSGKTGHSIYVEFKWKYVNDGGGGSNVCKKPTKDLLLQAKTGTGSWATIGSVSRNSNMQPTFQTVNFTVSSAYFASGFQYRLYSSTMNDKDEFWFFDDVKLVDLGPVTGGGSVIKVDTSAAPALRDGNYSNGEQFASCLTGASGCALAKRTKGAHWHYFQTTAGGGLSLRSPGAGSHSGPDVGIEGATITLSFGYNLVSFNTNRSSLQVARTLSWIASNLTSQITDQNLYVYEVRTQEPTGTTRRVLTLNQGTTYVGDTTYEPDYAQSMFVQIKRKSGSANSDTVKVSGMEFAAAQSFVVYDNKTMFFAPANVSYASALTFVLKVSGTQYCRTEASLPCPGGDGQNAAHPWGELYEIMRWNAMTQAWESGVYDSGSGDWVWTTGDGMPFAITPGEGYILKYRNAGTPSTQFWQAM